MTVNLGRICKDFARITSDSVDPGGVNQVNLGRIHKDFARITSYSVGPWGVDWQSTWEGSTKTLQGLPQTVLILGDQLAVNLGRIREDFERITSYSVDPGGSIDSQLGKDLQRLCKDYLRQC